MNPKHPFKWRHFQSDIILVCVRWYLRYPLSYRNLEEMMLERGLTVDHTTVYRWVQAYAAELDKRCRPHWKPTLDSWRVDETYIEVKGEWKYLYRAVDSQGNTLDFMLSAKRDARAAERFFRKVLKAEHNQVPRVINVDKNAAYPPAIDSLTKDKTLPKTLVREVPQVPGAGVAKQNARSYEAKALSASAKGHWRDVLCCDLHLQSH